MLFAPKIAQGIGEGGLFGGTMIGPTAATADSGGRSSAACTTRCSCSRATPSYVAQGRQRPRAARCRLRFSPSLLGSTAVAEPAASRAQVDPGRGQQRCSSPTCSASACSCSAPTARATRSTAATRRSPSVRGNARSGGVRGARRTTRPLGIAAAAARRPPGQPGADDPAARCPMPRSMFLGMHYSLAVLPEQPMRPRKADPRVGYFDTAGAWTSATTSRARRAGATINRWRLEKKDPSAELSEPVKPIAFWLDRTIPAEVPRRRSPPASSVWNDAFERIGFKNAIVVKMQPDDADFDTLDVGAALDPLDDQRAAVVRRHRPEPRSTRAPARSSTPTSRFESLSSRNMRALRSQVLASRVAVDWPALMQSSAPSASRDRRTAPPVPATRADQCQHADMAAEQLGYALDVLEARGEHRPGEPRGRSSACSTTSPTPRCTRSATRSACATTSAARASTPTAQLADPEFTRAVRRWPAR